MTAFTGKGAIAYSHSMNHLVEFFSKGGSIKGKDPYYSDISADLLELFKAAWFSCRTDEDKLICMKLLFWCRDCRSK